MKHVAITLLIIFLVFSRLIYAGQPAIHIFVNDCSNYAISKTFKTDKWVSAPFIGIFSHIAVDNSFQTSGIDYQYHLAVIRPAIMFFSVPDKDKMFFLWESFWALFPDLIDKNFGTHIFHETNEGNPNMYSGQTNLSEEISILLFELRWQ